MKIRYSRIVHAVFFFVALAGTAVFYSYTIFNNFCMDGDTLNWAVSLSPLQDKMTFLNSFAIKGWFSKFHLFMYPSSYLITKAYSFWGGWDYLMGFKIYTLVCAILTIPLIFTICKSTMRYFFIMLIVSVMPLYVLGYSWMITTCDDNVLANFFNLLFLLALLIATGAIREKAREKHCLLWAFITGIAAGFSMASHLKNIVSLPLILALVFVRPPDKKSRSRIGVFALLGFLLTFGVMYCLYWMQSAGEPVSSKLDFWVFHRVSGRFYPTPGSGQPSLGDHLVFVLVGMRSSLYAFQELFVHTNFYDKDLLGHFVIAIFLGIYFVSAYKTWSRRAVKILFALFLLHVGHSFLYDSWVAERWDYFTVPVFITVGIYWDSIMIGAHGRGAVFKKACFSLALLIFFGFLVLANLRSCYFLLNVTNNSMAYSPSAKKWPYPKKFFFGFNHKGLYELGKALDQHFDEGTYFLSLRYVQEPSSPVFPIMDNYLKIYSRNYRNRSINDILSIGDLVRHGKLKRLLFLDTVNIPPYADNVKTLVVFAPGTTKTVFQNNQVVLKEMVFQY